MGFTSASCSAYRTRNGVMSPGVSAGSKKVGASEKWTAQVICPEGGSERDGACARAERTERVGPITIVAKSIAEKTRERPRALFMGRCLQRIRIVCGCDFAGNFAGARIIDQAALGYR